MSIFVFRFKIFSLISQFLEVAQVKGRFHRYNHVALSSMRAFSFFCPKLFSSISQFPNVAKVKKWCKRNLRGALKSKRDFSFSVQTILLRYLAQVNGRCHRYKRVALCSSSIFIFRFKKFSFDITISDGRTGEREVSVELSGALKSMRDIKFSVQ